MAAGTGEWEEFRGLHEGRGGDGCVASTIRLSDGTTIARSRTSPNAYGPTRRCAAARSYFRRAEAMARLASFTFNVADGTLLTSEQGNRLFSETPAPHRNG